MLIGQATRRRVNKMYKIGPRSRRRAGRPQKRKNPKIYKNFISLQLAFSGWIGR
jgi:hypothetical protein